MTKKPTSPEKLCLAARERAAGAHLSVSEVEHYYALLDDHRRIEDPDDPPSYDWTGGAPLAGGSTVSVSETAAQVLRKCGGNELVGFLTSKLENASSERQKAVEQSILLLGVSHRIVIELLRSDSAELRETVVSAFMPVNWSATTTIPGILAPLLMDTSDAVVRRVNEVLRELGTFAKQLREQDLPVGIVQRARAHLDDADHEGRRTRLESYFYATFLAGAWSDLASYLVTLDKEETSFLVRLARFDGEVVRKVLEIDPALRATLKVPISERFQADPPGRRYSGDRLACFAPDRDAFELILEELRCRPSAALDIARFLKLEPSWMPETLEAAFFSVRETQVDALGFQRLALSDIDSFVRALLASPHVETRLETLRKLFRCLPDISVGDRLMADLRLRIATIQSERK
jgi:hypothetical protein